MSSEFYIPPIYYYDPTHQTVLVGEIAFENYIEEGNHPADLINYTDFLRDRSVTVDEAHSPPLPVESWTKEDSLVYGKWLLRLMQDVELSSHREKTMSREILTKAYLTGMGPPLYRIEGRSYFNSLREFYKEVGVESAHLIENYHRKFSDWEITDFVKYIKRVARELGRRPTEADLLQLAKKANHPSPSLMRHRYGSLSHILDLAGYPRVQDWDLEDYVQWGVKVTMVNDGRVPTTSGLIYLSTKKRGPSDRIINSKFGSVKTYRKLVQAAYQEVKDEEDHDLAENLEAIEHGLADGSLPAALFEDLEDDNTSEKIKRYAKYLVLSQLNFTETLTEQTKVKICTTGISKVGFVASIRKKNNAFTAGDIEQTANYLHVFDYIWPMEKPYFLILPDDVKSFKYKK